MRKANLLFAVTVFLSGAATILATGSEDKKTLTVTAVTHDTRVNEQTSYHTKPGQSTTDCTGTGTNSTVHVDCDTKTTSPTTSSITTRTTGVTQKVKDSEGTVYTIVCTDRPNILAAVIVDAADGASTRGGNTTLSGRGRCVPLKDGDRFEAEIKDTTMWVYARKGGNQGKPVKIKYKILDIRQQAPSPLTNTNGCLGDERDVSEVWQLGRRTGGKDVEIAEAIQTFGICGALSRMRKMDAEECRGSEWDVDRALSLGASLGEKHDEIMDAIKQFGVCRVFSFLRQEQDDRKSPSTNPSLGMVPHATAPQSLPPATPTSSSLPAGSTKSDGQSALTGDDYTGAGGGHWINEVSNNGGIVTLEDGSLWQINAADRVDTALWLPTTNIMVLESRSPVGDYKYILVNKDDGEKALAKYLGKE